jgi:hypothetical protein
MAVLWPAMPGLRQPEAPHPAPISALSIPLTSPSEKMVVVVDLPLDDWPKLQKFKGLETFAVSKKMASEITDAHVKVLSRLKFPKLRQISLAQCSNVTDAGLQALTIFPSIEGLQLIGVCITDRGMLTLGAGFPRLTGINVEKCRLVTERGLLSLTNSRITGASFSVEGFSQSQVENIISTISNVTWWTINDSRHVLAHAPLRVLGESRKITIQVWDETNAVQTITLARPR